MKQGLIITGGVVLIIMVCVVWAYLLFFGTPQDPDALFANLGFGDGSELPAVPANEYLPPGPVEAFVDLDSSALAQLTTRHVVGHAFVERDGETFIQYVEQGVGHVYEIDLAFAQETRVLGKTFTAVTDAAIAPDGSAVVLLSTGAEGTIATIETIGTSTGHILPNDLEHVSFVSPTKLRYTLTTEMGMNGYEYNLETNETIELFNIPFRDATVVWSENGTYVFNRPAPYLKGALYEIGNTLMRVGNPGYGLTALRHPQQNTYVLTTVDLDQDLLVSSAYSNSGEEVRQIPVSVVPEKCTFSPVDSSVLWCGAPVSILDRTALRSWYQGTLQSNDILWRIDTLAETARAEVQLNIRTGRVVDVSDLRIDTSGTLLVFKNKVDGTLWYYDTQFNTVPEETFEESEVSTETVVE